jgi:hypothetical protein
MLHRVTARDDPHLPRVLRLRERLDAKPLTGSGLPSVTIGRSETLNDFALYCENFPIVVSRRHATVTFDGEVYRLEDNNACNGTVVRCAARGPELRTCTRRPRATPPGPRVLRAACAWRACSARTRARRAGARLTAPSSSGPPKRGRAPAAPCD